MVDGEECGRARPCPGRDQFLFRSDPAEARRPRLAAAVAVHWVGAGYGVSRYKQVVVMVAVSPIDIKQTVLRNGRPSCSTSSPRRGGEGGGNAHARPAGRSQGRSGGAASVSGTYAVVRGTYSVYTKLLRSGPANLASTFPRSTV